MSLIAPSLFGLVCDLDLHVERELGHDRIVVFTLGPIIDQTTAVEVQVLEFSPLT